MPDFDKALQSMKAADLAYIQRVMDAPSALGSTPAPSRKRRIKRVNTTPPAHDAPLRTPENMCVSSPVIKSQEVTAQDQTIPDAACAPTQGMLHKTTIRQSNRVESGEAPSVNATGSASPEVSRTRQAIPHEWPPVGAILSASYFGTEYRAEVIAATKRLKSGKQLRLLDGPAKGKRLDSFSKAMLVATAKQRRTMKLGRKGASNGWLFWQRDGSTQETSPNAVE